MNLCIYRCSGILLDFELCIWCLSASWDPPKNNIDSVSCYCVQTLSSMTQYIIAYTLPVLPPLLPNINQEHLASSFTYQLPTIDREIFMVKIIRVLNFHVKKKYFVCNVARIYFIFAHLIFVAPTH